MVPLLCSRKLKKTKGKKSLPGSIIPVFYAIRNWILLQKSTACTDAQPRARKKREVPQCTGLPGVFTLEATVVLPALACFFVMFLFFFRVMQVELVVQDSLNRTGRQLAVYASGAKGGELLENTGVAIASAFVAADLKNQTIVERYVSGGMAGVILLRSDFKGDVIDLVAESYVKLPVELLGKKTVRLTWHVVCRKWTGYIAQAGSREDDTWVYITDTGQAYHRQSSCTYLTLSITSVSYDSLGTLRNENGGKYYECERCAAESKKKGQVYITNQGNRYHYDLNCSGIKRTVRMIRLSEVGDKKPCSRCACTGKEET